MSQPFVHLNVHSEYSIRDGIVRVGSLVEQAVALGMPAVAITDLSNLFAMVKFYRTALARGVKPIIGAELLLLDETGRTPGFSLVLLCQDQTGYRNLIALVTRAYQEGQERGQPRVLRDWLASHTEGLIALSGAERGDLAHALLENNRELAGERLRFWQALFGDRYYLELRRTGKPQEEAYIPLAVQLALETGVAVVATNAVCFHRREDFEAHEARVCIQDGDLLNNPNRIRRFTPQQYLRSGEEMGELFSDLPEALENSIEIARRCNFSLQLGTPMLPDYEVPDGLTVNDQLGLQARQGLDHILRQLAGQPGWDSVEESRYRQRLESELAVISDMGFPGYFLIVADFIRWSWKNGVPVGPGRGSGAGSLVAYALGITRIDPIKHDLLFERFLNPERVSLPDFDIDFCMEGRDRVIEYVAQKYGRDRVSQIITYGTMAAKAVVRDVGRVLGLPYGFVDSVAKLIPMELGITLERALDQQDELRRRYQDEDEVRTLIDLARPLEGVVRNAGKHAGGVVIAPDRLTEFVPLFVEPGGEGSVTQFDKDDVEALGLVKFDFLGLRTLTIIDQAVRHIRALDPRHQDLDIDRISLNDRPTYELLMRGDTTGIFQLESRGMKELIGRLLPDCFEDIVALVALYRPGPLQSGMVDDFINRKHGKAAIDYLEPRLQSVLHDTYGVILYQEQVMQIAQILAGYSLGQADLLRRAMGKKKPEEMAMQRAAFLSGAQQNGVPEKQAGVIFDLMEKFAGYGFNKSHSAAYAQVTYQTAWLKANFPAAFMAATLSADMDNTDKIVELLNESRRMGIQVRPPDVNTGAYHFLPLEDGAISYGLGAIKGVGRSVVEGIVEERATGGVYADLYDLCARLDTRKINRRVLEALICAGAMDSLGGNRASLIASLARAMDVAEQQTKDRISGQNDLFGNLMQQPDTQQLTESVPWSKEELLQKEREVLGCYFSGHPVEFYAAEQQNLSHCCLVSLADREGQQINVLGQVISIRPVSRGRSGVVVLLEDETGRAEFVMFRGSEEIIGVVQPGEVVVAEGKVTRDRFHGDYNIQGSGMTSAESARARLAREMHLVISSCEADISLGRVLSETIDAYAGGSVPLFFDVTIGGARGRLRAGAKWRVHPKDDLIRRLQSLKGVRQLRVVY